MPAIPTITGLAPANTFTETSVNAAPQLIDSNVTFVDADNDFNGGTLTLTGLLPEDRVSILSDATITAAAGTVSFNGIAIGTYSGGVGAAFSVAFNADATAVGVDALIQHLAYANVSDTPTATRSLVLDVVDAAGHHLAQPPSFGAGAASPFANGGFGAIPAVADIDGDGRPDVVLGNDGSSLLAYHQNADGSFTQLTGAANPFASVSRDSPSPAFIDVNGDGRADLVVGSSSGALTTLIQNADHSFTPDATDRFATFDAKAVSLYWWLQGPAAYDYNGDGRTDLVIGVTPFSGDFNTTEFRVEINNGDGTFTDQHASFEGVSLTGQGPKIAFIDIDGDGDTDLFYSTNNNPFNLYRNNAGQYTLDRSAANPFLGSGGTAAAFADLDGDGDLDAVIGNQDGTSRIYINNVAHTIATTINVTAVDDAPVLDLDSGGAGNGSVASIDEQTSFSVAPNATVADADSPDFAGGSLTIAYAAGGTASDYFTAQDEGGVFIANGHIGISGTGVYYNMVQIGTISSQGLGQPYVVTFNASATAAAVQALVRDIHAGNISDTPPGGARNATFTLTDGDGGTVSANAAVTFVSLNDAPVVTAQASVSTNEQIAVTLDPALSVHDAELDGRNGGNGDYAGAVLRAANNSGTSAPEDVLTIVSGAGFTVSGNQLLAGGLVFGTVSGGNGSQLVISFTSSGTPATTALVNAVAQALRYNYAGDAPPASVDISISLNDGSFGNNGQGAEPNNSFIDAIGSDVVTVNLNAINDAPVNSVPGAQTIDEDAQLVFGSSHANAIKVADVDAGAGTLTVTLDIADGALTLGGTSGLVVTGQGGHHVVITGTAADINTGLNNLAYQPASDASGTRTLTVTTTDNGNSGTGGAQQDVDTITINITPVDDPAVAMDDPVNMTDENATVNIAVLGNDSDLDGPPPSVAMVDGTAISVGSPVTLASGAKVSLNNDGTLTYDPNGAFNTLTNISGGESGAVNTAAPDNFTYTLAGTDGGTATVSVTVNGVANAADHLNGNSGDNNITGTPNGDYFDLSQGGNDTASGLGGDDGFFFGAAFTAADQVDGGAGTNDQIALNGDYASAPLVLGANTIVDVEAIVVQPGYSYNITTNDGNVAAGGLLKVQATQLAPGESLTFNGSAEHDGTFLIFGGQGNDNFTGGEGNDGFYFGPGAYTSSDVVNGGPGGNDQIGLDGDYTITLGDNISGIEVIVLLHGPNATPNHFDVTAANSLVAAGGTMTIFGLQVTTDIIFDGSAETNGAFRIYGGSGNDFLQGGTGNDWIFGGDGNDTLYGHAGNDTFYFDALSQTNPNDGRDGIQDFTTGDKIDLSGLDAISGGGDDAFTFIDGNAFGNHAGELRAVTGGGNVWTVSGDTNGDGVADFELLVVVTDAHPLTGADFTL